MTEAQKIADEKLNKEFASFGEGASNAEKQEMDEEIMLMQEEIAEQAAEYHAANT